MSLNDGTETSPSIGPLVIHPVVDGPIELYYNSSNFKAALYEKLVYPSAAAGATPIGNALYNIQIFDENFAAGTAEGNYQSIQVRGACTCKER